jgi:hypothetical protein
MAKRSIVFPSPEQLVRYARKSGLTVDRLWETFESQLVQQPRISKIIIRGPKQVVTIELKKDSRKLKKQTFAGAELGVQSSRGSETDKHVEREEDAGKASAPSIRDIVDQKNISDMSPAVKKGHNRTPWPVGKRKVKKPRYPIPEQKPNRFDRFLSDDCRERRELFREKWAEANRTHDWPSWLVCDYDDRFVVEILQYVYPNLFTSEKEKYQAAITLEAINVFLRGHKPSENSPLHGVKDKSIARRVQRFLRDAEKWWEFEAFIHEFEDAYDRAEATAFLSEEDDDVVSLWRKRLDDEE